MTFRSADPIADFHHQEDEDEAYEKMCPICSLCGEHITGEVYYEVHIHGLDYTLCPDCIERKYVENYVNEQL